MFITKYHVKTGEKKTKTKNIHWNFGTSLAKYKIVFIASSIIIRYFASHAFDDIFMPWFLWKKQKLLKPKINKQTIDVSGDICTN